MDFIAAVRSCLQKYAVFAGRAPRSEYWFFSLFSVVVYGLAGTLTNATFGVVALALLLPTLAVGVRRLHDIDRSGKWILIIVIPLVGPILWMIWMCTPGWRRANRFGPDPLPYQGPHF
jgi:uncharacterized membrane protein YhaH (DUF805 family)